MEFARKFEKLGKNDAGIAGGKGASLGEMTQAGIPVPPGFVVLADAFEQFLSENELHAEIEAALHLVDHKDMNSVESASEKIRSMILGANFPEDIAKEVETNFNELDAKFVAVRSSATAEDGSSASWAGELESYLNTTKVDLLENIKKCWASLFTPRAIFYRIEKEMHKETVSVAVVVQKMIQSEVSGITFTVHPVTEDRNQMVIEAGFGLGEAIVGGMITPDNYVINKSDFSVEDIYVSEQEMMIQRAEEGRGKGINEEVTMPEDKREVQKLSGERIVELAKICLNIEKHYGFPCDIEWAFEGGKFYVVQSRPITTLS
jgi:pyruvate,water dikinase